MALAVELLGGSLQDLRTVVLEKERVTTWVNWSQMGRIDRTRH